VSEGITARLKSPLRQRADFSEVLAGSWTQSPAGTLAQRPVYLEGNGKTQLGELFTIEGRPSGRILFEGDLSRGDGIGAGLSEGQVTIQGDAGAEVGLAMSGGALVVEGDAGDRAGAAPLGFKRGMSGGELIVRGSAGIEAGAHMRRGLLAIGKSAAARTGLSMIAGNVVVFGAAGPDTGLWSKRGSVVALADITPPATYAYACTYHPVHLRLLLRRLQAGFGFKIQRRYLTGLYRRYSGDMAELGKGEILVWTER
jgi:formylmethanofuran dehydrogenase subunit C